MKDETDQVKKLKENVDNKSVEIIQAFNNVRIKKRKRSQSSFHGPEVSNPFLNEYFQSNCVKENTFWLESECEKHRMVIRENFLNKEYQDVKNKWKELLNIENEKIREEIFHGIHDWNDQLV